MYNDERNKTLSELRKQTLFRRFAFILLFVILAGSLAGVGSLLFSNSSITDETGRGEAEVEVAAITGGGTSASPWIITTKADLQAWAGSSTYWAANTYTELAADIDWGGSGGGNYPRVTGFAGTFDGKQHVVKNIYMNYTVDDVAFFSTITTGANIKNFGLVKGSITGKGFEIGGIVGGGSGSNMVISDCFNTADINNPDGGGHYTAGIAARVYGTTTSSFYIKNCFNGGKISGPPNNYRCAGGIYGIGSNIKIENCFNFGEVTGYDNNGGIIGDYCCTSGNKEIINCYNVGTIGKLNNGGITGQGAMTTGIKNVYNAGVIVGKGCGQGDGSATNAYNNSQKTSDAGGGTNLTTAQMTAYTSETNNCLTSGNALYNLTQGDGAGKWYKRPNDGSNNNQMYYPELKVFAEHTWKALRNYSKESVRVSGPTDPGYNNIINTAPTCTANTTVNDVPWIGNGTK